MAIRSNRIKLLKKDPHVSSNSTNPVVKVFEWKAGALEISQKVFSNLNEAKHYVSTIKGDELHIKMYNEHRECIHSEVRSNGNVSGWLYA
jgi:hypothetical protein